MDEQTKELLYNLAFGIIDLINENERLQRENEELRAYKEQRFEMDAQHLQTQMNTLNEIGSMVTKKEVQEE